MTATCPSGHVSATTDYCDQCGAPIGSAPAVEAPRPDTRPSSVTSASPMSEPCPQCGSARGGRDRFCESCGFDFDSGVLTVPGGPPASSWAATVAADRDYFERVAPEGLAFPEREAPRTIELDDAASVRIGRRRSAREAEAPEIELADPAVSRLHAKLVRAEDGSWAIVDAGSSNGTTINAGADPIPPNVEVPLQDGDRVHVGAWTTITLALRSRAA